jgi:serine/threonine-protein kinase
MKNTFLFQFAIITLLSIQTAIAQSVGIGTATPDASARLEVNSTTQGILIPTLTSAQRSIISNPATGLLVFQTDGTPGFYYYTGTSWINLTNGHQVNSQGIAVSSNYGLTTTFAGSGAPGAADGTGTAASFNNPVGITADAFGNVYVADYDNHKIRKITAAGVVTTLAGNGFAGNADGVGTAASFNYPSGVAVDASGNIYVADWLSHKIRKITPAGVVSTFAGDGLQNSDDGPGTTASFDHPSAVAIDTSGNIYVADYENHKIRKITAAGMVSTLAGSGSLGSADGPGNVASFTFPSGVAVDASGNVYVADWYFNKIRKITPAGVVSTFAGDGTAGATDGTGIAASFNRPEGVVADASGNIYVADRLNHKIRKITTTGLVSTLAGSGSTGATDGPGTTVSFNAPFGVAVDASGNVYVADLGNNKIRKIIAH